MKSGKRREFERGMTGGGPTPDGYRRTAPGEFEIDKVRLPIFHRMAELRDTGFTYEAISRDLNAAGYRAVQSTPLIGRGGEMLGMISTHFRQPHRPSERELRFVDLYARQAAEMEVREEPSERARDEAYEILAQARQTAAEIVQGAKERADAMLAAARTQAAFVTSETRNLSQEFLDSL